MKKKMLASIVALSSMSLGIVGVSAGLSGASVANPTVLTEETNVGVTFTDNFNPIDANSVGTSMAVNALSFEPLIQFDSLKAGVSYPWIASSMVLSNAGKTVTFTINSKAKWAAGGAVTATDVANEFNAINTQTGFNTFGVSPLSGAAVASGNKVTLNFASAQYSNETSLGSVLVFPVAGDAGIPTTDDITGATQVLAHGNVDSNGPYTPTAYTSSLLTFKQNANWGITAKPYVTEVHVPSIASNQAATEALAAHQLDWAGNDIPQIQSTYVAKDPAHNKYYYAPGSTVTLWFNLGPNAPDANSSCLADYHFRKAVSMAMNRSTLSSIGETGYEPPATSSSGLMPSQASYEGSYANDFSKAPYSLTGASASAVDAYLTSNGYNLDLNGFIQVHTSTAATNTGLSIGTECHFNIIDPSGYSDYAEDEQLISATLQGDNINVTAQGVTTSTWYGAYYGSGAWDAMVHWGNGGTNPYTQFQNWLDDSGQVSSGVPTNGADFGDYINPTAQTDLSNLAAAAPGTAAFQTAVTALSAIMSTQVPEAPILYGADWDVYSTARFTGWVTPTNQYGYPGPGNSDIALVLTHLTKA